jgi:hypothetical protein
MWWRGTFHKWKERVGMSLKWWRSWLLRGILLLIVLFVLLELGGLLRGLLMMLLMSHRRAL